jgi:acyl-CoA thioester hydrolase
MSIFSKKGTVRWSDTDAAGVFHFSAAFIWVEEAEHELYRTVIPGFRYDNLPRRSVAATYNAPFRAGETYGVELWVEKLGNTSATYGWSVMKGDEVAVQGQHTVIHMGSDFRPAPLPGALRTGLERFLKSSGL